MSGFGLTFAERTGIDREQLRARVADARRADLERREREQAALLERLGREFRAERAHDGRSNTCHQ